MAPMEGVEEVMVTVSLLGNWLRQEVEEIERQQDVGVEGQRRIEDKGSKE